MHLSSVFVMPLPNMDPNLMSKLNFMNVGCLGLNMGKLSDAMKVLLGAETAMESAQRYIKTEQECMHKKSCIMLLSTVYPPHLQ